MKFMDSKDKKLEQLNAILHKNELGFIYDFLNNKENGLVLPFFARYMDYVNEIGLDFCVTTDKQIKAGIIYKHNLIFMSYGLFDRLCKLALLIHSSGALNGKPKEFKFTDLHLVDNPFVGFNQEGRVVGLETDSHLLLFVFDCLLGFVVAHEIGHCVNNHGNRIEVSDDIEGHVKVNQTSLIQSHTRELVADNYAFRFLRQDIEQRISSNNKALTDLLPEFKNEKGGALLALLFVSCYFKLMDGQSPYPHFKSTHPESAIRVHSIFATYLEPYTGTNEIEQFAILLPLSLSLLKKVFKHKDADFELDCQGKASTPEMIKWYSKIYAEYTNWSV
jgi:hypothetical protein